MTELLLLVIALFAPTVSGVGLQVFASRGVLASKGLACASAPMVSRSVPASGANVANVLSTSGRSASKVGTVLASHIVEASEYVDSDMVLAVIAMAMENGNGDVFRTSGGIRGTGVDPLLQVSQISVQTGITAIHEKQKLNEKLAELRCECTNPFLEHNQLNATFGDIIEFKREMYSHFGIYIGKGYIAHFFQPEGSATYLYRSDTIEDVANGSKCRINNLEAAARRRGVSRLKAQQIWGMILNKLNTPGDYHLLDNNCEIFVTECRYGLGFSEQSSAVEDKPLLKAAAIILGPVLTK